MRFAGGDGSGLHHGFLCTGSSLENPGKNAFFNNTEEGRLRAEGELRSVGGESGFMGGLAELGKLVGFLRFYGENRL